MTVRKTIDLIIGTFCIARHHALLTADREFAPLANHLRLRRHYGRDVDAVDAVAIMTDCDNRTEPAEAWYGLVRFLPK